MRQMFLAAAFAVVFHGWLLSSQSAWLLPDLPVPKPRRAVTISLAPAPAPESTAAQEPPVPKVAPQRASDTPPATPKPAPPPPPPEPKPTPKPENSTVEALPPPEPPKPTVEPPPPSPFSSLFDAVKPAENQPLIPEGIAALAKEADRPPPGGKMPSENRESEGSPPVLTEARPLYRENPPPDYPRVARRRGYEGTVVLEVLVDEAGRVEKVKLAESSGYGALDRAAHRSVQRWKFVAGRRGEQPVKMRVRVPVRFELK